MLDSLLQPDRASGQGMVFAYAVNMVLHRMCADCPGHSRRVCREDIYGDKGAPTIHYSGRDIVNPLQIIRHSFYIMD